MWSSLHTRYFPFVAHFQTTVQIFKLANAVTQCRTVLCGGLWGYCSLFWLAQWIESQRKGNQIIKCCNSLGQGPCGSAGSVGLNVVNEFAVRKKRTAGMICLELNLYDVSYVHVPDYLFIYFISISKYLCIYSCIFVCISLICESLFPFFLSFLISVYLPTTNFSVCVCLYICQCDDVTVYSTVQK